MPKFITGRPAAEGETANNVGRRAPADYVPTGPVPVGLPPRGERDQDPQDRPQDR
jgi:hypothetical protein